MKIWLPLAAVLVLALAGCVDFANRAYRCGDSIPVRPFLLKVLKTEWEVRGDRLVLKVSLEAVNRSAERQNLSRARFVMRIGSSHEVGRDLNLIERFGAESAAFAPGETAELVLPFTLPRSALDQPLALIVDRQPSKKGAERLTLVRLKSAAAPAALPAEGEWRVTRSTRWE